MARRARRTGQQVSAALRWIGLRLPLAVLFVAAVYGAWSPDSPFARLARTRSGLIQDIPAHVEETTTPATAGAPIAQPDLTQAAKTKEPAQTSTPPDVGISSSQLSPWLWLAPGTLALVFALTLLPAAWRTKLRLLSLVIGGAARTFDSKAFADALSLWHPALVTYDPTPRGIKRFANRARLLSVYEEHSAKSEQRVMTHEVHVVALAALHQVAPNLLPTLVRTFARDVDRADERR